MKFIIIHGDYVTRSYARLVQFIHEAKRRGWEISDFDKETIGNQSLFAGERFVVLRDYKTLNKKDILRLNKYPGTLVIYYEGNIPQTFLKTLTSPVIEEFKLPKIIWNFLDNFSIDNFSIRLFHEVIKTEPVEFVFSLLAKRFRDLYWVQVSPETLLYQSWRISKLKKQASNYSTNQLSHLINKLAKIDIDVKTSKANLTSSLDFLFLTRLE